MKSWYAGKSFTSDWTTAHFKIWSKLISPVTTRDVLEIGSWEGRSAIFFLEHCPQCRITCVDTFAGGQEHAETPALGLIEQRFDSNLADYENRVTKLKSRSISALDRLGVDGRKFDLVYIDGSHQRDDVLIDSVLSWRLVRPNGLLIWDDYRWQLDTAGSERPQQAIELFLKLHESELDIIYVLDQIIVRKRYDNAAPGSTFGLRCPRTARNFFRILLGRPITDFRPAWLDNSKLTRDLL